MLLRRHRHGRCSARSSRSASGGGCTRLGIWLYMCAHPGGRGVRADGHPEGRAVPDARVGSSDSPQAFESAAAPVTAFLIAPIAQFWIIPYMDSDAGQQTWGWLLGDGEARGIALVFLVRGAHHGGARAARLHDPLVPDAVGGVQQGRQQGGCRGRGCCRDRGRCRPRGRARRRAGSPPRRGRASTSRRRTPLSARGRSTPTCPLGCDTMWSSSSRRSPSRAGVNDRPAPISTGTTRSRSSSTRPAPSSASASVRLPQTTMPSKRCLERGDRLDAVAAEDLDLAVAPRCRRQRVRHDELRQPVDRLRHPLDLWIGHRPVVGEHAVGGRAEEDRVDVLEERELVGVVRVDLVDRLEESDAAVASAAYPSTLTICSTVRRPIRRSRRRAAPPGCRRRSPIRRTRSRRRAARPFRGGGTASPCGPPAARGAPP